MGNFFGKKEQPAEEPAEAVEAKPRLQCKWDSVEVKRAFDDIATQYILEKGYKEDMYVSNVKIVLGAITCALALVAQFHPSKFPSNYILTAACVIGYFFFNAVLQVFGIYRARDVILFTHSLEGQVAVGGLEVSSSLQRFSDMYSLTIVGTGVRDRPAKLECSVASWVHEDGTIEEPLFKADVDKLLAQLVQEVPASKKKDN